jgi:hypothetical protein
LEIEKHNVRNLVFQSTWGNYLVEERPELAGRYFICVETNSVHIAMIYVNGELFKVLLPSKRVLFWRGLAEVTAAIVDVVSEPEMPGDDEPLDLSAISVEEMSSEFETR